MKSRLVKVVTWRCISIMITLGVMYGMTGNVKEATNFTVFLHVLLTGCHYSFETTWDKINDKGDK